VESGHVLQGTSDKLLFLVTHTVSVESFPLEEGERKASLTHRTMSSLAVAKLSNIRVDERPVGNGGGIWRNESLSVWTERKLGGELPLRHGGLY
jgi:hypothetical protein